jgi:hypothetical protein
MVGACDAHGWRVVMPMVGWSGSLDGLVQGEIGTLIGKPAQAG